MLFFAIILLFNLQNIPSDQTKDIFPTIINLPEIIDSFANLKCLVHIDNYKDTNLLPSLHPINLMKLHVVPIMPKHMQWKKSLGPTFQLSMKNGNQQMTCRRNSFQISCSYIFNPKNMNIPIKGNCSCIDKLRFIVKAKPWNCLVQIELYPNYTKWYNPKIFQYELPANDISVEYIDQSVQPQVIILIDLKKESYYRAEYWMSSFIQHTLANDSFGSQTIMSRFLIAHPQNIRRVNFELYGEITELRDTEICYYCKSRIRYGFFRAPELRQQRILPNRSFQSIVNSNGGFAYETNIRWEIRAYGALGSTRDHRTLEGIIRHLQHCPNYFSNEYKDSMKSLAKIPFDASHDKLFHGMAHLLLEIMGNASYETDFHDSRQCTNGIASTYRYELDVTPRIFWTHLRVRGEPTNRSLYRWLSLPTTVTNLRFVSCGGNRGMYDLAFGELLNVYEYPVWLFIMLSSILLALTISVVKNETLALCVGIPFRYLLNTAKVLIEQGDPFTDSVMTNINLRSAVGGFLLMGIVLSNAYKSTNVYNMIKQRRYIPYEIFNELVDNNFTIYTRAAYVYIGILVFSIRMEGKNYTINFTAHDMLLTKYTFNAIRSEVLQWSLAAESASTDLWRNIVKHTTLHPKLEQMTWSLISPYVFASVPDWHYYKVTHKSKYLNNIYFPHIIWKNESDILYESLKKCTKTALIATEPLANELGRKLQMEGKQDVYVGKEVYSNISITLFLSGFVKPHVHWRMKAIVASGLWDWWPQFIQKGSTFKLSETHRSVEDERPDMSGNILLIFMLLIFGISGGMIMFSLEVGPIAYRVFVNKWLVCYASLIRRLGGLWETIISLNQERKPVEVYHAYPLEHMVD